MLVHKIRMGVGALAIYWVYFNANGGSPTPPAQEVKHGKYVVIPTAPNKTGMIFLNWVPSIYDPIIAPITFIASWSPKTFTVTFNANGGGTPSINSKSVTYDSTYGTLATVSRTCYDFLGWYTSPSGGSQVTTSTAVKITSNQTLYARWSQIYYYVYYNLNGGTGSFSTQTKWCGETLRLHSTTPFRLNYLFTNWVASNNVSYNPGANYTANAGTTLTAAWNRPRYSISYNLNGGTGSGFTTQYRDYTTYTGDEGGESTWVRLHAHAPTKSGSTFLGWYSNQRPDRLYQPNNPYGFNASTTMIAQWS